jgi:hypothetical protein
MDHAFEQNFPSIKAAMSFDLEVEARFVLREQAGSLSEKMAKEFRVLWTRFREVLLS